MLLGVFVSIVIAGQEANVVNGAPDPYGIIKNIVFGHLFMTHFFLLSCRLSPCLTCVERFRGLFFLAQVLATHHIYKGRRDIQNIVVIFKNEILTLC